jgi:hypothetical protein
VAHRSDVDNRLHENAMSASRIMLTFYSAKRGGNKG